MIQITQHFYFITSRDSRENFVLQRPYTGIEARREPQGTEFLRYSPVKLKKLKRSVISLVHSCTAVATNLI